MTTPMSSCPGCDLVMPRGERIYDRKFHASAECWSVFEQVLEREFQDAVLFGRVHQLTVDAYCAQHAGGRHPDKSVCLHLAGLYLVLERGLAPMDVPPKLQRIATRSDWPHLEPPEDRAVLTIRHVALADSAQTHALRVREWAAQVWESWRSHHDLARELAESRV